MIALGLFAGTALRLVLAALVLALPTVLMGGVENTAAGIFFNDNSRGLLPNNVSASA